MKELDSFNAMVRKWADKQPAKYRLTALAFGYPCNRKTHSFDQTLEWVSRRSRKRDGEGVSESTLKRHLKVFEASGVITVERRRNGSQNMSSVYHVDFAKVVAEDADRDAWLNSLGDLPKHVGWDINACPACQALPDGGTLETHIANGGDDPWAQPF
jgi:DNA-binding transcriptional ArsR family regulator